MVAGNTSQNGSGGIQGLKYGSREESVAEQ